MEPDKRSAVIELYRAGRPAHEIYKLLKYPKSTVYDIIKRYKDRGESTRKEHTPRSDKIRTPRFLAGLKRSIKANPDSSINKLATDRNVSSMTISRAINNDLGYKCFKLRVRHLLTPAQKEIRLVRTKKIISSLKSTGGYLRFFSDEKLFTVDRSFNRQNDRWICQDPEDVPMVYRSKNPASIMVLGVVSSEGDVMVPHFFEVGLKINQQVYLEVLQDVVVPWMKQVARGRNFTFQQDSAPAHKARSVQSWLLGAVPHFWTAQE